MRLADGQSKPVAGLTGFFITDFINGLIQDAR